LKTGGSVAAVGNDVAEDERETLEKQRQEAMLAVGGRRRSLDWTDEFLIYCLYHYGSMSQKFIIAWTQASGVSEILHTWADYLDIVYSKTFPGHCLQDEATNRKQQHWHPVESLIATFLNRQKGGAEKLKPRKSNKGGCGGNDDDEEDHHEQPWDDTQARSLQYTLFSTHSADHASSSSSTSPMGRHESITKCYPDEV
jgi:hypothetical protein